MNAIFLIARREFLQYARTRGFILTLLLVPGWVVVGGALKHLFAHTDPVRYFAVVDETGQYAADIDRALAAERQQASLGSLADWARGNVDLAAVARAHPDVVAILLGQGSDPAAAQKLAARGGIAALLPVLQSVARVDAAPFVPPDPHLVRVDLPAAAADAVRRRDLGALKALFQDAVPTAAGPVSLFALAVIPGAFSSEAPRIDYWSWNQVEPTVQDFLRRALVDALRARAASAAGLDAGTAHRLLDMSVVLDRFSPANAATGGAVTQDDKIRMLFPCGVALLTLLAILSIASMLLMAVMEEKSSRVIEMLLASTSPQRLLVGKLAGATAAAFVLMFGWIVTSNGAAMLLSMASPRMVYEALSRSHAFGDLPLIALCFVCGLATYATIFLGVGVMARSYQEAQSYLGPLMFLLFAPLGFLVILFNDPNGIVATAFSFSPLHAPFFLMIRLPHDPPVGTTAAAFVWMLACTVGLIRLMVAGFTRNIAPTEAGLPLYTRLFRTIRQTYRRQMTT